jgi:homoserine kinase
VTGPRAATAFAPAGVGNVAVGFDLLGHTLQGVGDRVRVERAERTGVRIGGIRGCPEPLPMDPAHNTATAGLLVLARELGLEYGFDVFIEKGIPLGSGMAGSAASAVGALVAANALLERPLGPEALLRYAVVGETVASGSAHGDNLAPGILGGLTLVRSLDPPEAYSIPVPPALRCALVHPHLRLDTRRARAVLPTVVPLPLHVEQSARLAGFLVGCFTGDLELIGRCLEDLIAEPHRAPLVPGFTAARTAALEAGALGASLSGAGPSIFAWCVGDSSAAEVRDAMVAAFAGEGIPADGWVSPIGGPGARVVEIEP